MIIWDKEFNILRIDGRVKSENLTRDEQYPIILDKGSVLAKLLIRNAHHHTKHGGNQLVLQYLRKRFWIIGAKRLIKSELRKCSICFKLRMSTSEQIMASLPLYRTTPAKASVANELADSKAAIIMH